MKTNFENQRYPIYIDNRSYLSTDINFDSISQIRNYNTNYTKKKNEINSLDVDKLLDKTQHSLNDFLITLTNEQNTNQAKSYRKIPKKTNCSNTKINRVSKKKLNRIKYKTDSNIQKMKDYSREVGGILETQRKLLNTNIDENKSNELSFNTNKIVFRKKTDGNLEINKRKKMNISNVGNSQLMNNSYSRRTFIKRDLSPIQTKNTPILKNEKSYDNITDEASHYKKLVAIFNKKNTMLINENEKYKKEIIFLKKFKNISENLEMENKKLKQKLLHKKNNNNYNLSISNESFSINRKYSGKNKDIISSLKKEIKSLKQQLNKYKNNENKNNNIIYSEHDINIDQIEKIKKQKNDLEEQNIFLIQELNNIKKNQDFIVNNNFLDKKNKSLNNQIINMKEKIKSYNNLQIYIKLLIQNKCQITDEKEQFLTRKIQEELDIIEQKQNNLRNSFQPNNNYFQREINNYNNNIYNINGL